MMCPASVALLRRWTAGAGDTDIGGSRFDGFLDPGDGDDIVRAGVGNDHVDASCWDDTVYGFDVGIDHLDLGGADYDMTRTDDGLMITLHDNSSMLLSGVFDLE